MKHLDRFLSSTQSSRVWTALSALALFASVASMAACEEKPEPRTETQAATKAALPEPAPAPPAPEPVAAPTKERKKFEDCDSSQLKIENADLEASIRVKAQKPDGQITTADLKKLRSLNLSRVDLPELDVCLFHHMSELRELFLGPSGIDDLSPISNSKKMETLGVASNPIEDLSPLSEMTKLDRLDLAKTKVKDLGPLTKLTALTELTLDGTEVEDLSPLSTMTKLERLSLKNTQIKDIKPIADFKSLKFLYIADSRVDISQTGSLAQNGTKVVMD